MARYMGSTHNLDAANAPLFRAVVVTEHAERTLPDGTVYPANTSVSYFGPYSDHRTAAAQVTREKRQRRGWRSTSTVDGYVETTPVEWERVTA